MGINKFYYSNEFTAKIDYCEFEGTMERFRSKLDFEKVKDRSIE